MESETGTMLSRKGWATIAAGLKTMYAQNGFLETNKAMDLWYRLLCDIPDEVVAKAADEYMAQEHFPPTVSDIRKRCFSSQAAQLPDWEQGWGEVMNAIHRYGYMREAEALASLSPITAETVKCLGYQALCMSENPEGDRIAFREVHSRYTSRARENLQLPDRLKVDYYQIPPRNAECPQIEAMQESMHYIGTDQRTEGYAEAAANRIREVIDERQKNPMRRKVYLSDM